MSAATGRAPKAEYGAVIYLRGTHDSQLDDAECRCRDYAGRFGWRVLESIRDSAADTSPGRLLATVTRPGAHILLTDIPDMIAPDQSTRHDLISAIERTGCIVHPIRTSRRP